MPTNFIPRNENVSPANHVRMQPEPGRLDPPERELVQRAASGDHDAFAVIYRRYQHVVYRFGLSMTACPASAEDIAQEVFVALFGELARYDPDRASFTTYLYGIVRNLSRDRLRRERRFLGLDALGSGSRRITYLDDPGDALEGAELAARVRAALRKLPTRYCELIILCDLHGLASIRGLHSGRMFVISSGLVKAASRR